MRLTRHLLSAAALLCVALALGVAALQRLIRGKEGREALCAYAATPNRLATGPA